MKKKAMLALAVGGAAGALMWYKKKNPDFMCDMKKGVKKAAQTVADKIEG